MIGHVIGNYEILGRIGEGGMGTVYKGIDRMLEREVAVKVLRADLAHRPKLAERFRSEAVTLAKVNHPNVATLYSFLREGNEFYMIMEFVRGRPLDELIGRSGALSLNQTAHWLGQALDGIYHAHRLGIVHRDIKPANIMITDAGMVKVMDFGIARVLGEARMTRTGHLIGTLEYMSPEQIRSKDVDARSDIYALGILLYEMLTGQVPFQADSDYELMRAQIEESPRSPGVLMPHLPASVEKVVLRALQKDPARRFQTAAAFREALEASVGASPRSGATPIPAPVPPTRFVEALVEDLAAEAATDESPEVPTEEALEIPTAEASVGEATAEATAEAFLNVPLADVAVETPVEEVPDVLAEDAPVEEEAVEVPEKIPDVQAEDAPVEQEAIEAPIEAFLEVPTEEATVEALAEEEAVETPEEAPEVPTEEAPAEKATVAAPVKEVAIEEGTAEKPAVDEPAPVAEKPPKATRMASKPEAPVVLPKSTRAAVAPGARVAVPRTRLVEQPTSASPEPQAVERGSVPLMQRLGAKHYAGATVVVILLVVGGVALRGLGDDAPPPDPQDQEGVATTTGEQTDEARSADGEDTPQEAAGPLLGPPDDGTGWAPDARPVQIDADIPGMLEQARQYFEANNLTTPSGENAQEMCLQVLQLDADNTEAVELLQQIARRYAAWGDDRIQSGETDAAIGQYQKGLAVARSHPGALEELVTVLQQRVADAEARLAAEETVTPVTPSPADPPETVRTGTLRVVVRPFGDIYIEDERKARETNQVYAETLPEGTYRVRAVHKAFGSWEKEITVQAGQPREVLFNFNTQYRLTVTSAPANAEILVDGEPTGRFTPSVVRLRPGQRTIAVRKRGFKTERGRITIERHARDPLHFSLQRN